MISGVISGVVVATVGREHPDLSIALVVIAAGFFFATLGAIPFALLRRDQEARAGYTTAPHAFVDLATVDPRTGFVLREAGEALLTPEAYERRRSASESVASE